jgi:hypothetical protein
MTGSATAFPAAIRSARAIAFSLGAVVVSLALSGCNTVFCGGSQDSVTVVGDKTTTVTEVCMLGRCVSDGGEPFNNTTTYKFGQLARSAKVKSTTITVKYKRADVPQTLEVDVASRIERPPGESCDPTDYTFFVRLT